MTDGEKKGGMGPDSPGLVLRSRGIFQDTQTKWVGSPLRSAGANCDPWRTGPCCRCHHVVDNSSAEVQVALTNSSVRLLPEFKGRCGSDLCRDIVGRRFETAEDYLIPMEAGGCYEIVEFVAKYTVDAMW